MNVVFGLSVEDLSERAIAHLGYEKLKFLAPCIAGDTITSESLVLSKRDTSKPDRGVVKFRNHGHNQRGRKGGSSTSGRADSQTHSRLGAIRCH